MELTAELLRLFIQKIEVHEKSVKWFKHAQQTVEIHYTDIGYVGNVDGALIQQENIEKAPETERPRRTSQTRCPLGFRAPLNIPLFGASKGLPFGTSFYKIRKKE